MRHKLQLAVAAGLLAITAAAPAANADVSTSKGKKICKEAGEAQSPDAKVRVNARDIRATETSLVYRISVTNAEGERTNLVCTVDKTSGEAELSADES